jgi:hypothetical protein
LGASSGALGPGMNDQSAADPSSVRPADPPKTRRLGEGALQPAKAVLVHRRDGLGRRAGERLLGGETIVFVDDGDDRRRARLELLAEPRLEAALDLVLGELADDAAGRRADCRRGEQRRRRQADQDADAAAPAHALAAEVVAGLRDADPAVLVVLDEDHALALDLLVLDELDQPVEVLLGRLDGLVAGHDHIEPVSHDPSLFVSVWSEARLLCTERYRMVTHSPPDDTRLVHVKCSAHGGRR